MANKMMKGVAFLSPEARQLAQQKSAESRKARNIRNATLPKNARSKMTAIREKCLDCSAGSKQEVRRCVVKQCPLWWHRCRNPEDQGQPEVEE
jgi:hypothetical protein